MIDRNRIIDNREAEAENGVFGASIELVADQIHAGKLVDAWQQKELAGTLLRIPGGAAMTDPERQAYLNNPEHPLSAKAKLIAEKLKAGQSVYAYAHTEIDQTKLHQLYEASEVTHSELEQSTLGGRAWGCGALPPYASPAANAASGITAMEQQIILATALDASGQPLQNLTENHLLEATNTIKDLQTQGKLHLAVELPGDVSIQTKQKFTGWKLKDGIWEPKIESCTFTIGLDPYLIAEHNGNVQEAITIHCVDERMHPTGNEKPGDTGPHRVLVMGVFNSDDPRQRELAAALTTIAKSDKGPADLKALFPMSEMTYAQRLGVLQSLVNLRVSLATPWETSASGKLGEKHLPLVLPTQEFEPSTILERIQVEYTLMGAPVEWVQ